MLRRISGCLAVLFLGAAVVTTTESFSQTTIDTVPGAVFGQIGGFGSLVEGIALQGDSTLMVSFGFTGAIIFRVNSHTTPTLVAGTFYRTGSIDGEGGDPRDDLGDGLPATEASLNNPLDVEADADGNIYIADTGNGRVRRVDASTGIITTIASGIHPMKVAVDPARNVFISDGGGNRIRRVDAVTGVMSTVAGTGYPGYSGDFGPATAAWINFPEGLDFDAAGNLFFVDKFNGRIRRVDATTGIITTYAGSGPFEFVEDCVPSLQAGIMNAVGLAIDSDGNLFVSTPQDLRIRRIDRDTHLITTVAGTGVETWSIDGEGGDPADDLGDGGPAALATVRPADLEIGSDGALYVADWANYRVRRIELSGDSDPTDPSPLVILSPPVLWPPNHRMVEVQASVSALCSTIAPVLSDVSSSESDDAPGSGDGNTSPDIEGADLGTPDVDFLLRAERDSSGAGRTYAVTYSATYPSGVTKTATATVFVPHDHSGIADPVHLSVSQTAEGTLLRWDPVPWAYSYDVVRTRSGALRDVGHSYDLGDLDCIEPPSYGTDTQGFEDGDTPAPGEAFLYMVAYTDEWGHSGYGAHDVAKPRVKSHGGCP